MKKIKKFLLEVGHNIYQAFENGWLPPFILLLLLLLPPNLHAQTERAQKQAKVIEKREGSPSRPIHSRPLPRVYRSYYYNPIVWGYNPYWNTPPLTLDRREYIIQPKPLNVSLGMLSEVTTQQPTLAPYLRLGNEVFGLIQYHIGGGNRYEHYDNIYRWEIQEWRDEFRGEERERGEFVFALGKKLGNLAPFIGLGFGKETQWEVYYDETQTLSQDGLYTINETRREVRTIKVGGIVEGKTWEIITQISLPYGDENKNKLRFGIGIGIQL